MKLLFFILFYLFFSKVGCQQKIEIVAKDETNLYKKKLLLVPAVHGKYYNNFVEDSANFVNGNYKFKHLTILNNRLKPYKLVLEIEKNKSYSETESFFLPSPTNIVVFNSTTGSVMQNENDNIIIEQKKLAQFLVPVESGKKKLDSLKYLSYKKNGVNSYFFKTQDSLAPEYNKLLVKEDSLMLEYSKKNSNSYVLLWKIVQKISENKYNKIYNTIYSNLDVKIRNSDVGKILNTDLVERLKLEIGQEFPKIIFDKNNLKKYYGNKYTLIDFWFSFCKPCLEQIPLYKQIYKKYKNEGFEYIGISTDRTKDISKWKEVIKRNELEWPNFLDENAVEAKKYNINQFPTTFLLDSKGKIIQRNISQEELDIFLKKKLK